MAAWVAAVAAILSMVVSIFALIASNSAKKASEEMALLDQKLELSLSRFKDVLLKSDMFASEEVTDLRLKGVDNSLKDLDHRTSRNTDHISMIFKALLTKGIDAQGRMGN
jgi:hypothetical protein